MKKRSTRFTSMQSKVASRRRNRWRIIGIICLIVLVGLGVLTYIRWGAWFGNKPESAYVTPQTIDRITLTPGEDFEHQRTISWRCDSVLQEASLEWGIASAAESDSMIMNSQQVSAEGQAVSTRSGKGCYYSVRLQGLSPGLVYRYRVHTGNEVSHYYDFVIPEGSDKETSFVYIGDVQDPDGSFFPKIVEQLHEQMPQMDFLAGSGDQIEGPCDNFWQIWYRSLGEWSPTLTQIFATGNHEYLKHGFSRELDPRWVAQYVYPGNGPEGFVGRSYFIDFPLMRFIVIDSNGINTLGAILSHREWLRSTLASSQQPWQVVMFHQGVRSVRQGRSNPIMHYGLMSILEEGGADLVLQGHDHCYSRSSQRSESGDTIPPVYIISGSSHKVYRNGFDSYHDRLGSGLQLYQHISVTPTEICYHSYQYSGELYDDISLIKDPESGKIKIQDRAKGVIPELFRFDNFGDSKKGKKKRAQYQKDVEEYLQRRARE